MNPFVLVAQCKHGNNIAFCSSNVGAKRLGEFVRESEDYASFTRLSLGDPAASARYCPACAEDHATVTRDMIARGKAVQP